MFFHAEPMDGRMDGWRDGMIDGGTVLTQPLKGSVLKPKVNNMEQRKSSSFNCLGKQLQKMGFLHPDLMKMFTPAVTVFQ